jgi:hypothetical protein
MGIFKRFTVHFVLLLQLFFNLQKIFFNLLLLDANWRHFSYKAFLVLMKELLWYVSRPRDKWSIRFKFRIMFSLLLSNSFLIYRTLCILGNVYIYSASDESYISKIWSDVNFLLRTCYVAVQSGKLFSYYIN